MDGSSGTAIRPQAGPQEAFLSNSADIVIYGGAAGGGKTWGLLLEPLRHLNNPLFRAVIFRRTFPQITNPGGLQDEAQQVYPLAGGESTRPSSGITWTFPGRAIIRFAHMQHEKNRLDWQGAQIPLICFDELTHFSEEQFFYMLSRNRSVSGIRPYIRATTNPDAEAWVAKLVQWWWDPETGYAIPERSGVIRWFVRLGGDLIWADSAEELRAAHPGVEPKSLTFIAAKLQDNRILMERNPEYLANLLALPLIERERLLGGNWKIRPSGGKVFNRDWYAIIPRHELPKGGTECRFWDFAATKKQLKGDDPDFTAGVKVRKVGDQYYVVDCVAGQWGPAEVDHIQTATTQRDREQAKRDSTRYLTRWEVEPGSASRRESRRMVKALDGLDAGGVPSERSKYERAKPFAIQSEHGFVSLIEGEWNEGWLTHMHHQPNWDHDDIMDATSGAYNALLKEPTTVAAQATGLWGGPS